MKNANIISTIAGGGAGVALLATVRWEAVPYGELMKLATAVLLTLVGYLMYRGETPTPPDAPQ